MPLEDQRTWALAHELSIDVYILASKFLMEDFKNCVAAYIIDAFETAGLGAALPAVLYSCKTLLQGVRDSDPLICIMFARVGFLQAKLWRDYEGEIGEFFAEEPAVAVRIMREMVKRRDGEAGEGLLPMENVDRRRPGDRVFTRAPQRQHEGRFIDDDDLSLADD